MSKGARFEFFLCLVSTLSVLFVSDLELRISDFDLRLTGPAKLIFLESFIKLQIVTIYVSQCL
jgi:hypothetical protein